MNSEITVMESVLEKRVDRILISVTLKDENGYETTNITKAVEENINVVFDIAMKLRSEDFSDPSAFRKGNISENSIFGYVENKSAYKSIVLYKKDFSKLSSALIKLMPQKMTYLNFSVSGTVSKKITIPKEIINQALKTFSCVKIDFGNVVDLEMPSGDFNLESFELRHCNGSIDSDLNLMCDSTVVLEDVSFYSEATKDSLSKKYVIGGNNITVYNLDVNFPLNLNFGSSVKDDMTEFSKTSFTGSDIRFNCTRELYSKQNESRTDGLFEDPLLSVEGLSSITLNEVNIFGADNFKGIRISKATDFKCSYVRRECDYVNNYTLGIGSIQRANINNFFVKSFNAPPTDSIYAIFLDTTMFNVMSEVSLSTFEVQNNMLMNFDDLKCGKVSIVSGAFTGKKFTTVWESSVVNLIIKDVKFNITESLDVKANSVSIYDSTALAFSGSFKCNIEGTEKIKLDGFKFDAEMSELNLNTNQECSLSINSSDIKALSFNINGNDLTENGDLFAYLDPSKRTVRLDDTNFFIQKFKLSNAYGGARFTSLKLHNIESIDLSMIDGFFIEDTDINSSGKRCEFNFSDIKFSKSLFSISETPKKEVANFTNCEGYNVEFEVSDGEEKSDETFWEINLKESKIKIDFNSLNRSGGVTVNSKNSLGSTVYSKVKEIPVSIDIMSTDKDYIKEVNESTVVTGSVCYGVSEDSISDNFTFKM